MVGRFFLLFASRCFLLGPCGQKSNPRGFLHCSSLPATQAGRLLHGSSGLCPDGLHLGFAGFCCSVLCCAGFRMTQTTLLASWCSPGSPCSLPVTALSKYAARVSSSPCAFVVTNSDCKLCFFPLLFLFPSLSAGKIPYFTCSLL